MLKTLTENNVLFYDEKNYNDFIYDVSQGVCERISHDYSSTCATFVCNIGVILANIKQWESCIPNVQMNYKVQANFDLRLIRILNQYNLQFSVATWNEIDRLLLDLDVEPSSLIYNSPVKYTRHIVNASLNGVNYLSVTTLHELERIVTWHPFVQLLLHCSTVNDRFINVVKRSIELEATIEGLCYDLPECSSNDDDAVSYDDCFNNLNTMVELLSTQYNIQVNLINLGSNIPLYDENENSQFQQFVRCVNQFTAQHETIKVIAEPTSFMFDTANELCCNVMGERRLYNHETDEKIMFYYLNDGVYGSLNNIFLHDYTPVVKIVQKETFLTKVTFNNVDTCMSTFWGPTCDSMDKICTVDEFPLLALGDTVAFTNVGLYNLACGTNFNGFNIPTTRFIVSYQKLKSLGISTTTDAAATTTTTTTTTDTSSKNEDTESKK